MARGDYGIMRWSTGDDDVEFGVVVGDLCVGHEGNREGSASMIDDRKDGVLLYPLIFSNVFHPFFLVVR